MHLMQGFNAQHCLLLMIEKWREVLEKRGETDAILQTFPKHSFQRFYCYYIYLYRVLKSTPFLSYEKVLYRNSFVFYDYSNFSQFYLPSPGFSF